MGVVSKLLRRAASQGEASIGGALASLDPNPNHYTVAGAAMAAGSAASAYLGEPLVAVALAAVSALLDAVDGMVARAAGRVSRFGAALDSVLDRVSDFMYHAALMFMGVSPPLVMASLGGSMIVPYVRAKGEALGVAMAGVGLAERGERTLVLLASMAAAAAGFIGAAEVLVGLAAAASWLTAAQRVLALARSIRG